MNRTMNIKGFAVIMSAILVVFFSLHILLQSDLHRKTEKENAMRIALAKLEDENKDLNNRLNLVGTDEYIVSSAMQNYSYVNRNDIRFEFSNPQALYAYTEEEILILLDELGE
ncbi:MAG: hypothetical protein K6E17_02845 [Clostridiales bacterium]|nr:hypothetical protein [Clostridiales bacterium]